MYHNPADDFSDDIYSVTMAIFAGNAVSVNNKGVAGVTGDDTFLSSINTSTLNDCKKFSMHSRNVVGLKSDGTVVYEGSTSSLKRAVETWTDIVDVYMGDDSRCYGIKSDGTVVCTDSSYLPSFKCKKIYKGDYSKDAYVFLDTDGIIRSQNGSRISGTSSWYDVVDMIGSNNVVVALLADGKVVSNSSTIDGAVSSWRDIVQIATTRFVASSTDYSYAVIGLKKDGKLVVCSVFFNNINVPVVDGWENITQIIGGYECLVGIKEDRSFYSWAGPYYETAFSKIDALRPVHIFKKSPDYECPTIANTDGMIISGMM